MRNRIRDRLTLLLGGSLLATTSLAGCSSEAGTEPAPLDIAEESTAPGAGGEATMPGENASGGSGGSGGSGTSGGMDAGSGSALSYDSDPLCERGILNGQGTACCDAACGECGGEGCEDRLGGEEACCAGAIGSSGVSCESANAPCAMEADSGNGGSTATGGTSGSGGSSDSTQPPAGCSNIGNDIPNGVEIHTVENKHVQRADFPDYSKWYTEDDNVQRFQLHQGDTNLANPNIPRPRVEAYAPGWQRSDGWNEFSANYYLESWESPWRYAVFQIKTNDASNFIIQGLIDKDGSFEIARRSKGGVAIDDNVFQKPFHLRVRSNGLRVEVYYNCEKVLDEAHPQPDLEDANTRYHFRWGLYRQQESGSDFQKGTTTMYVTGPEWN